MVLRWGILGTAAIADRAATPAMRECGHDLAVVGSRSLVRAQSFAASHGVRRARADYQAVVDADDVDAVYVCLPNGLHEEWTLAALDAGKHVLCEQPLSVDAASAGRMAVASASAGRVLMEAMPCWTHPGVQAALDAVSSGGIGEVRWIHATHVYGLQSADSFRTDPAHGGALSDAGTAPVAAVRWFAAAEPTGVRAVRRRWQSGVDAAVGALLAFPSGTLATLEVGFDGGSRDLLELVGTRGTLRLHHAFSEGASDDAILERDGEITGRWRADTYERLLAAFTEAVAGGQPSRDLDDAVATAEVVDRIRTSAL